MATYTPIIKDGASLDISLLSGVLGSYLPAKAHANTQIITLTSYTPAVAATFSAMASCSNAITFNSDSIYLWLSTASFSAGATAGGVCIFQHYNSTDATTITQHYGHNLSNSTNGKEQSITLATLIYDLSGSKTLEFRWTRESDTSTLYSRSRTNLILEFKRR
jgi:hypothetical protein